MKGSRGCGAQARGRHHTASGLNITLGRYLATANCESSPEEKLPRRLERYTFVETLPDCLPDIKYEFSKVEDDKAI